MCFLSNKTVYLAFEKNNAGKLGRGQTEDIVLCRDITVIPALIGGKRSYSSVCIRS